VIVAHRRCGKTVACIQDLILRAMQCRNPNGRYAYIAPLYNQAKDVAWLYLKEYTDGLRAGEPNETDLRVDLINGARIRLYGADNPDRLRGLYLDGLVLDEYADMAPSIWGSVLRPALADRQGWATFIGTPKGRNAFFDLYSRAGLSPDWYAARLLASQTGILPESELRDAASEMTPEQFAQEFECSFEAAILGAYFGKEVADAERNDRIGVVEHIPELPVHTAWDLGIGDSTAIWWFQAISGEVRVLEFYENNGQSLEHYVKVLRSKPYQPGLAYVPHDARVRELGSGRTRVEILKELGLTPKLVTGHKLMDGINAARLSFPSLWFDADKCRDGIEALRQYRADYDEKTRAFKDTPKHDWTSHASDAFRYLCMAWREQSMAAPKVEKPPVKAITDYTWNEAWAIRDKSTDKRRV
jgi:phage terminase large subunit